MTVTKQQQLEWLAKNVDGFFGADVAQMSGSEVGRYRMMSDSKYHAITREEWQQERDKISSKPEVDSSWHERGELPPAGCECEVNHENGSGWIRSKVISITSEYSILLNEGSAGEYPAKLSKTKFRPLDYEKTLFVSGVVEMASGGLISSESAKEFAMKLFDSGYRKVKL